MSVLVRGKESAAVVALAVLNVADAYFTLWHIWMNEATEANPFMAVLMEQSPLMFVLVKVAIITLMLGWLMTKLWHPWVKKMLFFVLVPLYSLICLWHLVIFFLV